MKSQYDILINARIAHYRAKVFVLTEKLKNDNLTADEMIELFNEKIECEEKMEFNKRIQNGELFKAKQRQTRWDKYQYNGTEKTLI